MKSFFFTLLFATVILFACNNNEEAKTATATTASSSSSIKLPYEANYTTSFTYDVSDEDLLVVLNSYKYWETNDMKGLRSTMGDSISFNAPTGFSFEGPTDSLMKRWTLSRDSLSSVVIKMDVWLKSHSTKDSANYITTWYKEIDTYKTGKVDSAYYADVNQVKNGKISWYSSYRQKIKL